MAIHLEIFGRGDGHFRSQHGAELTENLSDRVLAAKNIMLMALVFPFVIMTFGVFFMRQVIMAVPDELLEAARIDGANEFWIYVRVVLALSVTASCS